MATFQDLLNSVESLAGGQVRGADVATLLDAKAAGPDGQLEWRYSVLDLMKALDLDSDLKSRIVLARDLGYRGSLNGSVEMNIWLHKQILARLDEAGAVVPTDLKA
jgi:Domain of unknown function (DUF3597)